ncbi:MAG: 50S ribosomal protein L32 [Clostridia bacterium]|nr:50S ribosomal protein L32 [Clostridia bacterium]
MAVPKSKTSKARKHSRAANWKITSPAIAECPRCHEPKLAHRVCKHCGYYDGKQVLVLEKGKDKENNAA